MTRGRPARLSATAALFYTLENRLGELKEHERSRRESAEKLGFKPRPFQVGSLSVPRGMEYTLLPKQRAAQHRAEVLAPGPWSFPRGPHPLAVKLPVGIPEPAEGGLVVAGEAVV